MAAAMRRSKYGAVPTTIDNIRFHSKAEAARYLQLKMLQQAGEIYGLELQPKYQLLVTARGAGPYERVCVGHYIADFRYREGPKGILRIEDVKGYDVPLGKWKRRHCEAQYGIEVTVIK